LRQTLRIASNNTIKDRHRIRSNLLQRENKADADVPGGAEMSRGTIPIIVISTLLPMSALAKDTRLWNLTAHTITSVQLSPAGKNDWGRNQAENDRDGTVDHDERLKITDTPPGLYDVKFADKSGRTCVVPNIEVKEGSVFSIEEKSVKNCAK
jgi:hypothetical protein